MSAVALIRRRRGLALPQAIAPAAPVGVEFAASGVLSRLVALEDSRAEAVRHGSDRIHGSALAGEWCSRRHAIYARHGDSLHMDSSPRAADKIMWAIGRAVEHHIRTQLIAILGRERCLGRWSCLCGTTKHTGFGIHTICRQCRSPLFYGEYTVSPASTVVDGNPDLTYLTGSVLTVTEIKSKKLALFEALGAPEGTHVSQASIYSSLLRSEVPPGLTVNEKVHIVYGAKDYPRPGVMPYKDFLVPGANTWADNQIAGATTDLRPILAGNTNAPLPPRLPACQHSGCPRAKNCGAVGLCFSLS